MKKRSTLKLLMELYFVAIVEDASIFVNIIKDLTSSEHLKDREATQTNLSLLTSFARQGKYFLGIQQPGQEVHDEVVAIIVRFIVFSCLDSRLATDSLELGLSV